MSDGTTSSTGIELQEIQDRSECSSMKQPFAPHHDTFVDYRQPWLRGKLVGPTEQPSPGHMVLVSSPIDEHLWQAGADPVNGESLLSQVRRGPQNIYMFASCIGFVLPAMLHFCHGTVFDYVAIVGLLCVSITSPLCDALCISYGVFDDESSGYLKTSLATGIPAEDVRQEIAKTGAAKEVLAPDCWNNLTRLLDRGVCVLVATPCLFYFAFTARPDVASNVPYFGMVAVAFLFNMVGQKLRLLNPCGFQIADMEERPCGLFSGKRNMEASYRTFEFCHITWHVILIVALCMSAIDRPMTATSTSMWDFSLVQEFTKWIERLHGSVWNQ